MELHLLFLGISSSDGVGCVKKPLGLPLSAIAGAEEDEGGDEGHERSLTVKWLPRLESGTVVHISELAMLARSMWQFDERNELCEA